MTDDVDGKLDEIFNALAEKQAAAARRQQETEIKQDATLQEFNALKETLIRPTLEGLAQKLSGRGHASKVFETEEGGPGNGSTRDARVGIRFLFDEKALNGRDSEYPHLTLALDKSAGKIQFYSSTMSPGKGGSAGGAGSVDLGSLTQELINQKALKIIAEVYK
ncbi:hypothetical protein M1B34_16720 [Pseudomonas sp. MAFF 302030]|uniref:Uncharacterized protein n=1 Tax=Pseudomonas morbosilactucae TaxID=2938197 RepID=A0A9X1YW44_9PSED|nr:hypothetical protein [Pseudomonas morbosilactucae]MCK9799303.1 hypothetical protein [Pseudomonas morbosilactucae]